MYTILVLLNTTNTFMRKSRSDRDRIVREEVRPFLAHFQEKFEISMHDCDFTDSRYSDFMIARVEKMEDFAYFMGYLRESCILTEPYFEVKDIVIGLPQNFRGSMSIGDIIASK